MNPSGDLVTTVIIAVAAAALVGLALWRQAQPYEPGQIWRLPWPVLAYCGILVLVLALAHLITLVTGRPFTGRMGF